LMKQFFIEKRNLNWLLFLVPVLIATHAFYIFFAEHIAR
jgi:hypothetical protein